MDGCKARLGTPTGPQTAGLVRPYRPTTGVPAAAAMCIGPLSLPRNMPRLLQHRQQRFQRQRADEIDDRRRGLARICSAGLRSSGPPTSTKSSPVSRAILSITAAKRSGCQRRPWKLAPACTAMKPFGRKMVLVQQCLGFRRFQRQRPDGRHAHAQRDAKRARAAKDSGRDSAARQSQTARQTDWPADAHASASGLSGGIVADAGPGIEEPDDDARGL